MKRIFAILLALAPFAAIAGGGGGGSNNAPPPWNPSNKMTIVFAYNIQMQVHEKVCWKRYVDWRYCKKTPGQHATEQADYLNYLFEKSQVNLQVNGIGVGLDFNLHHGKGTNHQFAYLEGLRAQYGAATVMVVNSDIDFGRNLAGQCGNGSRVCWYSEHNLYWHANWFESGKQGMAHEFGHFLGLGHDEHSRGAKTYAVGYGTWAFVDLMHYAGRNGKSFFKLDVFSDDELTCIFGMRCGVYATNSGARYLRERFGRYTRPAAGNNNGGGNRDKGHGGHGRH